MDHRRRGRRGRGGSYINFAFPRSSSNEQMPPPQECRPWSFLSAFYSYVILVCLIALIYMMLDFHCTTCSNKYDMKNITDSLEHLAVNISALRSSSKDIETWIANLPKFDSEIKILKDLSKTLGRKDIRDDFGWHSKTTMTSPKVYLTQGTGDQIKNCTNLSNAAKCRKCSNLYNSRSLPIAVV